MCEYCGYDMDDLDSHGADIQYIMTQHEKSCKVKHNGIKLQDELVVVDYIDRIDTEQLYISEQTRNEIREISKSCNYKVII